MSYEAMPCVLKNEDGTPMYGLLIKPLQSQFVIQLAPNSQQQPQQQLCPSSCPQTSTGSSVQLLAMPSRNTPSKSSAAPTKRHYPTILPRETGSTSKSQVHTSWTSVQNNGYLNLHGGGGAADGFANLAQSNLKVTYATAIPQSAALAAPVPMSMSFLNNTTPASFTQATFSQGCLLSQPTPTSSRMQNSAEQLFAVELDDDGGMTSHCLDNAMASLASDSAASSSSKSNVQSNCASSDLDSLLRDIDLNEISLIPLLHDCVVENGDIVDEGGFPGRLINSSAKPTADESSDCSAGGSLRSAATTRLEMTSDNSQLLCEEPSMSISRPPCRYQGLLTNSTLAANYSSTESGAAETYSRFSQEIRMDTIVATSGNVGEENLTVSDHAQSQPSDFDHQSHEATTPDSGIQSIGDSPHAGLQNSPMHFASSPDARRRRISSPRSQLSTSTSAGSCSALLHPSGLHQSSCQPVLSSESSLQPPSTNVEENSPSTAAWGSKYSQPLRVDTTGFESISECETSPALPISNNCAIRSPFYLNTPRCYSPSGSSECNESYQKNCVGSNAKRKKKVKKRSSGLGTGDSDDFNDMPILQPEGLEQNARSSEKTRVTEKSDITERSTREKINGIIDKDRSGAKVSSALLEKILSVVPEEELASLKRILDQRLGESTTTQRKNCDDTSVDFGESSGAQSALSRWQSTNAGYASDTSDVSSLIDSFPRFGKNQMAERNWRRLSASSSTAVPNDPKKEDTMKRLLDYRKKARMRCTNLNESTTTSQPNVVTRHAAKRVEAGDPKVLELVPGLVHLSVDNGKKHPSVAADPLFLALERVVTKLRNSHDAPTLVKESVDGELSNRTVPFNGLQNLESEASDDDEAENYSSCSKLTTPNNVDIGSGGHLELLSNEMSSSEIGESSAPAEQDLVEIKESPEGKNISVKIKLSLIRNSTEGKTKSVRTPSPVLNRRDAENGGGKAKRSRVSSILPPKKRFKDGGTSSITIVEKEKSGQSDAPVDKWKKRRHGDQSASSSSPSKKRRTKLSKELTCSPTIDAAAVDGPRLRKKNAIGVGILRRCGSCKTWIRVEESNDHKEKALCVNCRKNGKHDTETAFSSSKSSKTSNQSKVKNKAPTVSPRPKAGLNVVPKRADHLVTKCDQRLEKGVKATSGWKYPRKSYVKTGILHRNNGTSDPLPTRQSAFSVDDCKLLTTEMEPQDFQLPYDAWWYFRYQKDFTCVNPSENYRKLRSNVYVDAKQIQGFQPPVCNCVPPADESTGFCGDHCLNRMMFTECCASNCPCGDRCTNTRFQKRSWTSGLVTFNSGTEKGLGVRTTKPIKEGAFICEYLGEVVSTKTFDERMKTWYKTCNHHYALNLDAGTVIDGYRAGGIARFVNHSCEPNCEVQKWLVNGQYRMGIFALKNIEAGEELSYNYKFRAFSSPQVCLCSTPSCRGFVGGTSGCHQTRKNKPQRSVGNEDLACNTTACKINVMKPLSYRERMLVTKKRLFLLRNLDSVRKKLQAVRQAETGSSADEKRKAGVVLSEVTAVRSFRCMRTRRFAVSRDDQDAKTVSLVQLLKPLCDILANAQGTDGTLLFPRDPRSRSRSRNRKQPSPDNQTQEKTEVLDLSMVEQNLERGSYSRLESFDNDVRTLFAQVKNAGNEETNAERQTLIDDLEQQYESEKSRVAEKTQEIFGFQSSSTTDPGPSDSSTNGINGQSSEDSWAHIYWGTKAPFMVAEESSEELSMALWAAKGDSFDKADDKVHCVCGITEEDGVMIQCDNCRYWQHSECVGVAGEQLEVEYVCDFCKSGNLSLYRDVILSPQPEIVLPQCTYYRALMKNGLQVRIGETVYVKRIIDEKHKQLLRTFNRECVQPGNGSSNGMEANGVETSSVEGADGANSRSMYHRSELRVFRVERLFTGPRGVKFVFGSYFARPHETFCEPNRKFYRNEVFVTPLYDTLPLDAVVGRCLVMDVHTYCKGRPKYPKYSEEDIYICEYRVDKGQRLFGRMHVRNRFPIAMKPYIFQSFLKKLHIRRDFTPFGKVSDSEGQQLRKKKRVAGIIENLKQK